MNSRVFKMRRVVAVVISVVSAAMLSACNTGKSNSRITSAIVPRSFPASDVSIAQEDSFDELSESSFYDYSSDESSIFTSVFSNDDDNHESFQNSIIDIASEPEPSVQITPKPALQEYTFIVNIKTNKYHLWECSAAKRIKSENKSTISITAASSLDARKQIESRGYDLCGICAK